MLRRPGKNPLIAAIAAALASPATLGVSLNPDGFGQALIYPYYTVRSVGGNAFHTYLSVGNSTSDAKALRVRIREGRNGREALSFNLYLAPNDMWAGAVVPTADGAQLVTADASCTDPPFPNGALALRRDAFTDGLGDTLDRTREGFVEILEMATLTGQAASAIGHDPAGVPIDCGYLRATPDPAVAAPTGGLWGTLTLINVNSGQDFTLDATALDSLASRSYFRPAADPYPDFAAAEIDPVSVVLGERYARGHLHRSTWSRPQDAVSAVLMSSSWTFDYTVDPETASATDFVVTLPTRHYYVLPNETIAPFYSPAGWSPTCAGAGSSRPGEALAAITFNREELDSACRAFFDLPCSTPGALCAASGVASMLPAGRPPESTSSVLGSTTLGMAGVDGRWNALASGGWTRIVPTSINAITGKFGPLPGSVRVDLDSGQTLAGEFTFFGLPAIGFSVRTFNNGRLSCGGGACQGNYGSAFPMRPSPTLVVP
jgi:hypothetical protein